MGSMMPPEPTRIVDRRGGEMADDDAGRGARDALHAMMFGDPVAGEAEAFGMDGKVGGVGERGGDIATFDDGD